MTESHKRANRHPKYKTAYCIKNWPEYDQAWRDRGDITLWLSQEAIEVWTAMKSVTGLCRCGGPFPERSRDHSRAVKKLIRIEISIS